MSAHVFSLVLIIPAALQDNANRLACALGHDTLPGKTFSAPLSFDGREPIAYYGCRAAATQGFVTVLTDAIQGVLPPVPWGDYGLEEADVVAVLDDLIVDVRPASDEAGQYDMVIAEQGLKRTIIPRPRPGA